MNIRTKNFPSGPGQRRKYRTVINSRLGFSSAAALSQAIASAVAKEEERRAQHGTVRFFTPEEIKLSNQKLVNKENEQRNG